MKYEDVNMNYAEPNGPDDRLAMVVTEPLSTNKSWGALEPGKFKVFVDGVPLTD